MIHDKASSLCYIYAKFVSTADGQSFTVQNFDQEVCTSLFTSPSLVTL